MARKDYVNTGDTTSYYIRGTGLFSKRGQSFFVEAAYTPRRVRLKMLRAGNPGTFTVQIYQAEPGYGNPPIGDALCAGSYDGNSLTTDAAGEWIDVIFDSYTALPETNCVVIITAGAGTDDSNFIRWRIDTSTSYVEGCSTWYTGTPPLNWDYSLTCDHMFEVWDSLAVGLSKPTTPTPANASGPGIDFSTRTLSWVDGGGAEAYNVRIGPYPLATNVVSLHQPGTSYVIPESDIALYKDNPISWRVDAHAGEETVIGDTWTFDPRPAKATTPSPADEAIDQSPNLAALSWNADAYTDASEVTCSWAGTVDPISTDGETLTLGYYTPVYLDHLGHNETYTWRVDAVNEWGITEGDTWEFTTLSLDPPMPSWELIVGGSGYGPLEGGVEGVDFRWLGNNFGTAVKRLVAAARNRIFYEDV